MAYVRVKAFSLSTLTAIFLPPSFSPSNKLSWFRQIKIDLSCMSNMTRIGFHRRSKNWSHANDDLLSGKRPSGSQIIWLIWLDREIYLCSVPWNASNHWFSMMYNYWQLQHIWYWFKISVATLRSSAESQDACSPTFHDHNFQMYINNFIFWHHALSQACSLKIDSSSGILVDI